MLSSASATTDVQQVQEYLVREQLNHSALASLSVLVIEPAFANPIDYLDRVSARLKTPNSSDLRDREKPTTPDPPLSTQTQSLQFSGNFGEDSKDEDSANKRNGSAILLT